MNDYDNPSSPIYEPDPFREERPFEGGSVDTAFKGLSQYFDLWRRATDAGNEAMANEYALNVKTILYHIENKQLPIPPQYARKFEFIRKMFMEGHYLDNARRRPVSYNPWAVCRAMANKYGWDEAKFER